MRFRTGSGGGKSIIISKLKKVLYLVECIIKAEMAEKAPEYLEMIGGYESILDSSVSTRRLHQ